MKYKTFNPSTFQNISTEKSLSNEEEIEDSRQKLSAATDGMKEAGKTAPLPEQKSFGRSVGEPVYVCFNLL